MFTDYDLYLFHEGTHCELYRCLGAKETTENNVRGVRFSVYAPNAKLVNLRIAGQYDRCGRGVDLDENSSWLVPMERRDGGIFTVFVPNLWGWASYRYEVLGCDGILRKKADPMASYSRLRPSALSIVHPESTYEWRDGGYMDGIDPSKVHEKPMSIYEVHLGSWKKDYRKGEDGFLNYRQLGDELSEYVKYMGFTHVELIGICEHPFDGSWGYQVTGFFSPTSRYGTPDDLRYFIDKMHENGIGVILDFVPAHFPKDAFGLEKFDGTNLYEPADPMLEEYPEWGTKAFDHKKPEVRSFLISSACYWINEFHFDALRVDAVASMLYLNFGRNTGRKNIYGGDENLDSIAFMRQMNAAVAERTKGYLIAEDSSIMPGITAPASEGGIGFAFKWNLGWMNDTLKYFEKDPVFRGFHHGELTHTVDYAFTEHFILVLSHDEVVHLKKSLLGKMQGADGDRLGALKTLYAYQFAHPGKKLLFMGQEFAEPNEWFEGAEINWSLASDTWHRDVMEELRLLNGIYRKYPCLHTDALNDNTFNWINRNDAMRSTVSFIRRNPWNYDGAILAVCNFTPVYLDQYTVGAPVKGPYKRIFSTFDSLPGGGAVSSDTVPEEAEERECDGLPYTLTYNLRPYETVFFEVPEKE